MKDISQRFAGIERRREARIRRMDHPMFDYTEWYCSECDDVVPIRVTISEDVLCGICGGEVELEK